MLLTLKLTSPLIMLLLELTLFRSHGSEFTLLGLVVLLGLIELVMLSLGLHEVVLATLALSQHLVTNALLRRLGFGNVIDSIVVFGVVLEVQVVKTIGCWAAIAIGCKVRTDTVQVVHLFALVVLEKALVCAQILTLFGVEALGDAIKSVGGHLFKHVFPIGLSQIVDVVGATLCECKKAYKQSCYLL